MPTTDDQPWIPAEPRPAAPGASSLPPADPPAGPPLPADPGAVSPTRARRLRWGRHEVEFLPPDARHPWTDPTAPVAPQLAPPPVAGPDRRHVTRRLVIVSCVAAFLAGLAAYALVSAVRRGTDAAPRPRLAPTTVPRVVVPTTRPTAPTRTAPTSAPAGTTRPSSPVTSAATAPTTTSATAPRTVLGVTVFDTATGVTITDVLAGSGAEAAGLRPGDVFVSVDGQPVAVADELGTLIRAHKPGDTVPIVVNRSGTDVTVSATLSTSTS